MSIASVVIEIKTGTAEAVLARLAMMPAISVYGMTESQIVTVIEGDSATAVESVLKEVQLLEEVIGVYPVYVGDDE